MTVLIKREFRSYFHDMRGFVFLSVFFLAIGSLMMYYGFLLESPTICYVISDLLVISALLCPVLSYKTISGEYRGGTDKLLYSLPFGSCRIVLGKYLALLSAYAIPTAVLALCPLIYNYFGEVNFGASYLSLFAFFAFCAAVVSVCMFFSAQFKKTVHTILASYIFVVVMYLLQIISLWVEKQDLLGGVLTSILSFFGIFNRFEGFIYNMFDLGALVYYLSVSAFFIFLTVRSVEKRRISGEV